MLTIKHVNQYLYNGYYAVEMFCQHTDPLIHTCHNFKLIRDDRIREIWIYLHRIEDVAWFEYTVDYINIVVLLNCDIIDHVLRAFRMNSHVSVEEFCYVYKDKIHDIIWQNE